MDSIPGDSLCIMADSLRSFFARSASASLGRVDHRPMYTATDLVVDAIFGSSCGEPPDRCVHFRAVPFFREGLTADA